ncbi:hypothetical protein [Citrobacter sp. Cb004]|uniref:hypothetical protein n=1 Tax=Citrobacter sp. Cb004 TaxID=2985006 RepID=UPI002575B789|nr:hypothetical protein [Citrobacter sp. Cb004]MDM3357447.1 hypothetical protein [Citrobacter sp. Cb004]
MTTNNHPAHGPVSLDRLHQIREILSKAAAQSDGGNLGYAMADAVKVIDGAIAAFGAEPVLYAAEETLAYAKMGELHLKCLSQPMGDAVIPLYTAPPAPVVPEWTNEECLEFLSIAFRHAEIKGDLELDDIRLGVKMVNGGRAAMLQAGNSPVTPDGWQLVPKEPTAAMNKAGWDAMNEHDAINPTYRAMLAAAPKQEVE